MPKLKIPKTLGACVDLCYQLREKRFELERQAKEIAQQAQEVEDHIVNKFSKDELNGARGVVAQISVKPRAVPQVKDWEKFYAYIKKNNAFDLLQRRVGTRAVEERWDAGKVVPGVESITLLKVSLTKVAGSKSKSK